MARIVLTTWGSYGDLNPFLGLGAALKERGHDPLLAAPGHYRAHAESEGMRFHAVRPDIDPSDHELVARIMEPKRGTEVIVRELLMPSIQHSYDDLMQATEGADLLVSHPVTFAGPLVGGRRRIPWLSSVLAPMSFFSRHDIPAFPPAPWTAQMGRVPGAGRLLTSLARAATRSWTAPVRRLRSELGLPAAGEPVFEGQFSPAGTLALFSRVMAEPQPDWPPRVSVTGFIFYDRTAGPGLDADVAHWLADGEAPLVFTLGSSAAATEGAAARFFSASAAAARALGRRALLIVGRGGGRMIQSESGSESDGTVRVVEAAPYSTVFPRAAAVVHQGGIGTTAQALAAGVPQLVVPFAHDQPDNAVRVERLGVAGWVPARRYSAPRAAALLRELLSRSGSVERARAIGKVVRSEDGAQRACLAIEAALDGGATPQSGHEEMAWRAPR